MASFIYEIKGVTNVCTLGPYVKLLVDKPQLKFASVSDIKLSIAVLRATASLSSGYVIAVTARIPSNKSFRPKFAASPSSALAVELHSCTAPSYVSLLMDAPAFRS